MGRDCSVHHCLYFIKCSVTQPRDFFAIPTTKWFSMQLFLRFSKIHQAVYAFPSIQAREQRTKKNNMQYPLHMISVYCMTFYTITAL